MQQDAFFWKSLKSLSASEDNSQFGDDDAADNSPSAEGGFASVYLDPIRSLLVLLIQCINSGVPKIALPASELFLLLCRVSAENEALLVF